MSKSEHQAASVPQPEENADAISPLRRERKLSQKGLAQYEETASKFLNKLLALHEDLQDEIDLYEVTEHTKDILKHSQKKINLHLHRYVAYSSQFCGWCVRKGTYESLKEKQLQQEKEREVNEKTNAVLEQIKETLSNMSCSSKMSLSAESHNSSKSSKSAISYHKAKASLDIASQEAQLKKEKAYIMEEAMKLEAERKRKEAEIDSNLELLKQQKEAVLAKAEYEAALDIKPYDNPLDEVEPKQPSFSMAANRTKQYILEQNAILNEHPAVQDIHPYSHQQGGQYEKAPNDDMNEFTRFLLKKDLLLNRFSSFNDRPECYSAWRANFASISRELKLTSSEELDLLIKYLGPDSTLFAQSIRTANSTYPTKALYKIWERLEDRFGCVEMVEASIKRKLDTFHAIDNKHLFRLYDLHDITSEILSLKQDPRYEKLLSYFDTSAGVKTIINKLPGFLQGKWRERAFQYKTANYVAFPPFEFFVQFIHNCAKSHNDPSLNFAPEDDRRHQQTYGSHSRNSVPKQRERTNTHIKTFKCIIHNTNHSLNDCRAFRSKPIDTRRQLIREHKLCFKCCESTEHIRRDCKENITCKECKSPRHCTAMHMKGSSNGQPQHSHGGEQKHASLGDTVVVNKLFTSQEGKSCAKIVPVNISHSSNPNTRHTIYMMLDEQSNRTLAKKQLFDMFNIHSSHVEFTLTSCGGTNPMLSRQTKNLSIESLDGIHTLELPNVIECDEIPNNKNEIATRSCALSFPHLKEVRKYLPEQVLDTDILLLVGRDAIDAHHVLEQVTGPPGTPIAHKLKFGWAVIGEMCIGEQHIRKTVNVNKTYLLPSGRPSILGPCENNFKVKGPEPPPKESNIGFTVFERTDDDDKPGRSVEDYQFMDLMNKTMTKDKDGFFCAPLPFKPKALPLPNNRNQVLHRANTLTRSLQLNIKKKQHFTEFMENLLKNDHAEIAPSLQTSQPAWYLPVFGVYHPKKPDQIRCVFDSSAKYFGTSLNDQLLSGPDLNNTLIGVLIRFRKYRVGISGDIQQMFYSFTVQEQHRDFLRFIWHKDNDIKQDLVDYRMRVHVFGNKPSPAVAIYGLHKAVENAASNVKSFVRDHFYVDDGLISTPTEQEAIDLLKDTQKTLEENGNIKLHKFMSNSEKVMSSFPSNDLAKDLKDIDLNDTLPVQRSLGIQWDLKTDCLTFNIEPELKPFTRRGVLSTVNSLFDPLGFLAPVVIQGKALLRKFTTNVSDWDERLPQEWEDEWGTWRKSLPLLQSVQIPRVCVPDLAKAIQKELYLFSDASEKAIAAVAYLRITLENKTSHIGFMFGKAKLAPMTGHTIPRLELCAAVLAVEIADLLRHDFHEQFDKVHFYTDSKVVLGYISNQTRRFYVYVENRIQRIRKSSTPEQWNYVPTHLNPADQATRSVNAADMCDSMWLKGPTEFINNTATLEISDILHPLVNPEEDKELRSSKTVQTLKTDTQISKNFDIQRFNRFSSWKSLTRGIAAILKAVKQKQNKDISNKVKLLEEASLRIIKLTQNAVYCHEISCLAKQSNIPKDSTIIKLNPYLDHNNILRVGGRLNKGDLPFNEKHPIIMPGKHHVSKLLVLHYHSEVKHQGRHFTEGRVRSTGFWITGCKRLVSSVIHHCIICKKLRGKTLTQQMADLPSERLEPSPPFTNVGVDCFGPWSVVTRKTRGGNSNSKYWAVIFVCLVARAIHIELIGDLSSASFINAVRRFIAIRGPVKVFISDRGTNFVGAVDDLGIQSINVEDRHVSQYLKNSGCIWKFNPPHASHFGGSWERMIGIVRKILNSLPLESSLRNLTFDALQTFLLEVCAIVNSRPLVPVSSDPENPIVLSPSILLTQKCDYVFEANSLGDFNTRDVLKSEWKRVQALSGMFWSKWKREYIQTLQQRQKWHSKEESLKTGDVVLLKDKTLCENHWPLAIVTNAIKSTDNLVRQAEVTTVINGKRLVYTRPIKELVLLFCE